MTDEIIAAAGIHSETNAAVLQSILGWNKPPKKLAPALVFPFTDAHGVNGYKRVRPDTPRLSKGKPVKYETPRGQANRAYFPPGVAARLATCAELFITEGELKSLCATQHGFPCIGLVGVMGWKIKSHERLLPDLERIAWKGKTVFVVFDSDAATNTNVTDAESRLAKLLADQGAKVKIVRLPEGARAPHEPIVKVGLDDYLVAHGASEFRKLCDKAEDPDPPDPSITKAPAADMDPATEAENILDLEKRDEVPRLRFWQGSFWHWRGGRFVEVDSQEIRGATIRRLNKIYFKLATQHVANILDQLRAQSALPYSTEPPAWIGESPVPWLPHDILATAGDLLHLPSIINGGDYLRPATPRFFCTSAIDVAFDADAPRPEAWLAFLDQLWPDDAESIETLQQWFGYILTADTRQQKMLMLLGPTRSGKGTIVRVLTALVGQQNVAGPTLSGLTMNFGLSPLVGKSLATISDARISNRSDLAIAVERLLSISGEDPLTIDRKNQTALNTKISARLMLLSNELPALPDASGALAGRMIVLRLSQSFYGREDLDLDHKLHAELPGILVWSIDGWRKLRAAGRFTQPASGKEFADEMTELSSPILSFVRDCCEVDSAYQTAITNLFAGWKRWCESAGRDHPGTEQIFGRNLRAAVPSLKVARPRQGNERYRAYDGIRLRANV